MNRRLQMGCGEPLRTPAQRSGIRDQRASRANADRAAAVQVELLRKRTERRG